MKICIPVIVLLFTAGCGHSYYTEGDFPSVPKADAHLHISTGNGFFEKQALTDNFILFPINVDVSDSSSVAIQYKASSESAEKNPGRVFFIATFHFDTAGWGTEKWNERTIRDLSTYLEKKPVAVKIWKNIGMTERDRNGKFIMADDPGLEPIIKYIINRGLPVTGHLGEPRNCWLPLDKMTVAGDSSYFAENPQYHMFLHPEFPTYEDQINARDRLLEKHPDLIFIGCHLGSLEYSVDELAKRLDRFPNFAVDLSARVCHLQYQSMSDYNRVREFCIKYQDRLLYGTDLSDLDNSDGKALMRHIHETWIADWKYFASGDSMTSWNFRGGFRGLHLPREVIDKIFYKNAVRWYRLKV